MSSALCIAGQRIAGQRTVELAVPDAVEKALPLVPVVDQDPPRWVASHAHQHPVRTGGVRLLTRPRVAVPPDHGNLDSAVPVTRAAPALGGDVDAQLLHGRLAGQGQRATPQYSTRDPSLSAAMGSTAPHWPVKEMPGSAPV